MKKFLLLIMLSSTSFVSAISEKALEDVGTAFEYLLPATALGMTVYHLDREGNVQFFKAFLSTEITKEILKQSITSTRPNGGRHSFPSGHTSCSFASSAFIQRRYGWKYGIPAYLAASFVGYTRIQVRAHRFVDVLAGASLGIFFNVVFTTRFEKCPGHFQAIPIHKGCVLAYDCGF